LFPREVKREVGHGNEVHHFLCRIFTIKIIQVWLQLDVNVTMKKKKEN